MDKLYFNSLLVGLGIVIGLAIGMFIHNALINNVTPERGYITVQPTMIYEDGSYFGCLPERLCNE